MGRPGNCRPLRQHGSGPLRSRGRRAHCARQEAAVAPTGAMTVTIWHNPKCATSRKVLGIIRAAGVEPSIVEYVKAPPSIAAIKAALKAMGISPRDLLRRRGTPYDALGL